MAIHLLVLIHGMWGNPGHLSELKRIITDTYESSSDGVQLEVLVAETNSKEATYDGIDWGGERVAQEVADKVAELEKDGKTVIKFSVTGYSLGGLIARYLIGILYQRDFFKNVTPVNFNTVATPHIGLPRYPSFFSAVTSSLGPRLLSRTGEQFFLVDKWSASGRPLIEVMADPDRVFYQALKPFQQIRLYANAVNDTTVPYVTSAIETEDPFALHETNGITIHFTDEDHALIDSFELPAVPPEPTSKPIILSPEWFRVRQTKIRRPLLPPFLQFRFPFNIAFYVVLPVLIPIFLSYLVARLGWASQVSRARIKLLEKDRTNTQRLIDIFADLETKIEHAVEDLVDGPPLTSENILPNTTTSEEEILLAASPATTNVKEKRSGPMLTPIQVKAAGWLNQLPLKKQLAFFPDVRNAHGMIVCRDVDRFEFHRRGESILRDWAASFVL